MQWKIQQLYLFLRCCFWSSKAGGRRWAGALVVGWRTHTSSITEILLFWKSSLLPSGLCLLLWCCGFFPWKKTETSACDVSLFLKRYIWGRIRLHHSQQTQNKSIYFWAEGLIRRQGAQVDILYLYDTQALHFLNVFSLFSACYRK